MKRVCCFLVILVIGLLASAPCLGQVKGRRRAAGGAAAAVLAAQRTFLRGAQYGDKEAMGSVISEDFIQTAASGKTGGKAATMADTVATPGFEQFDVRVRVYGGAAVVTGAYGFAADDPRLRFTAVYRLSGGRWLLVAHQQTVISR
jgi:Domain of unknown function (DUF4440)